MIHAFSAEAASYACSCADGAEARRLRLGEEIDFGRKNIFQIGMRTKESSKSPQ
jgi:hypothetical protein